MLLKYYFLIRTLDFFGIISKLVVNTSTRFFQYWTKINNTLSQRINNKTYQIMIIEKDSTEVLEKDLKYMYKAALTGSHLLHKTTCKRCRELPSQNTLLSNRSAH